MIAQALSPLCSGYKLRGNLLSAVQQVTTLNLLLGSGKP